MKSLVWPNVEADEMINNDFGREQKLQLYKESKGKMKEYIEKPNREKWKEIS